MPENDSIRILYDGDCPICCHKTAFLKRRDHKGKLHFSDIRKMDAQHLETDISMKDLERQIHAIMPDGTVISRMDVIRAAYRAIGLGWITGPTGWPILRPLFDCLYGLVAQYRQSISRLFH
jgi:predicted DCC family thiol-disulfide oxidoreductase YuxK